MTLVLLAGGDVDGDLANQQHLRTEVSKWAAFARRGGQQFFVVAPPSMDVGAHRGLHHVAADNVEADFLLALADIAEECRDELWLLDVVRDGGDATRVDGIDGGKASWSACSGIAMSQTREAAGVWREVALGVGNAPVHPGPAARAIQLAGAAGVGLGVPSPPGQTLHGWYERGVLRAVVNPATRLALRWQVGPASLTVLSTTALLLTSLLAAAGSWPALALAALILQVGVVFEAVHGEVCVRSGRLTPFNEWLTAVARPLGLLAVVAGLGVGLDVLGEEVWLLTAVVAALVGAEVIAANSASSSSRTQSGRAEQGDPGTFRPGLVRRSEILFVVSAALLAGLAEVALVLLGLSCLVLALAHMLQGRGAQVAEVPAYARRTAQAEVSRALFEQCDPGPLALLVGREDAHLSLLRRLSRHPYGAVVPLVTWLVEASALVAIVRWQNEQLLALAVVLLGVLVFHRVDIFARRSFVGAAPANWVFTFGAGSLGRPVLYLVMAAAEVLSQGLIAVTALWAVLFATESASFWSEPRAQRGSRELHSAV